MPKGWAPPNGSTATRRPAGLASEINGRFAHRQGIEPCCARFGVEAVHQHGGINSGRRLARRMRGNDTARATRETGHASDEAFAIAFTREARIRSVRRNGADSNRTFSPRELATTCGIANEERPHGRSRWNRTIARTGMSRGGAQHGLRMAAKCGCARATRETSGQGAMLGLLSRLGSAD